MCVWCVWGGGGGGGQVDRNQINHYDKQRRVLMAILLCARVNENQ